MTLSLKGEELELSIFDEEEDCLADLSEKYSSGGAWIIWMSFIMVMIQVFVGFTCMETA